MDISSVLLICSPIKRNPNLYLASEKNNYQIITNLAWSLTSVIQFECINFISYNLVHVIYSEQLLLQIFFYQNLYLLFKVNAFLF